MKWIKLEDNWVNVEQIGALKSMVYIPSFGSMSRTEAQEQTDIVMTGGGVLNVRLPVDEVKDRIDRLSQ